MRWSFLLFIGVFIAFVVLTFIHGCIDIQRSIAIIFFTFWS